jgi:hypothetical protein
MKNKILLSLAIPSLLAIWTGVVEASFTIVHTGSTDPITEGFGLWANLGSSTLEPVRNDGGYEAWAITGLTPFQQYAYFSEPLNPSQQSDIENQGFVLTVVERVLQGIAPDYSPSNPAMISVVAVSTGSQRFDIDLGIDSNGDTVVVLADNAYYSGNSVVTPGASFTLMGSGGSYHAYQLVYDPKTQLADLFVDGIERTQNYAGFDWPTNPLYSLYISGANGSQVNFSSVQFTSSPIPLSGAVWLFGAGIVGLAGISMGRKKH